MPSSVLRTSYTISAPILRRFNASVPAGERSKVMERLMEQALEEKEAALAQVAETYLADPAFAKCREDESLWEATVADGLEDA